jgi:glycosyltransferase involved in cell wall biosynthesis
MNKPRVLILTGAVPYPLVTGAKIRTFNLLKTLAGEFEIELLTIISNNVDRELIAEIEKIGITCHYLFKQNLGGRIARTADAVLSYLMPEPYLIRHYTFEEYQNLLDSLLAKKQYDVLHCDSISMTGNLGGLDKTRLVLTQHNIEHKIWAGYVDHAISMGAKWFYHNQYNKVKNLEANLDNIYGHVVTVSENDRQLLANDFPAGKIIVVENGVDPQAYNKEIIPDDRSGIVFTGSLDWHPNIDGLTWFVEEIYPRLLDRRTELKISIVGRKPSASLAELLSGKPCIDLHADVPEIHPFLHSSKVMMVPLRIGGGSRLKILEAMASGLPVVSTTKGAEGLSVKDDDNIIIRDDPDQFADAMLRLMDDNDLHRKISDNGKELIDRRYAWDKVARPLADLWKRITNA